MAETTVVRPTAECAIGGIPATAVSGVTVTFTTGSWATAEVRFHPRDAEGKASQVLSEEVAATLGKLQELGFSNREEPDASINMTDGQGNTLKFEGFTVGPAFTLVAGHLERKATLVHRAAMIDGLKMNIYDWVGSDWADFDNLDKGDNWASRIRYATEFLVDKGRRRWSYLRPADAEIQAQQHTRNKALLPVWYELLAASGDSTKSSALEDLEKKKDQAAVVNNGMGQTMLGYLIATSDGFWNTMSQLCAAFQLVYVPTVPGQGTSGVGRLIRLRDVLTGDTALELDIVNAVYTNQSFGLVPLQQVIAKAMGNTEFGEVDENESKPSVIAVWPPEAANPTGQLLSTSMPMWLVPIDALSPTEGGATPQPTATAEPGREDVVDFDNYSSTVSRISSKARKAQDTAVQALLTEYVRNLYSDRCLAGSSFAIDIPLNLSLYPGARYEVKTSGKTLFRGFLAQAVHTMEIPPGGGQGQAVTRLAFSHVELGSFRVPGA